MAERLYGNIPQFDVKNDDWQIYKGQISMGMKTFKVKDEEKTGFLLCYCGTQLVSLIYNICSPKDVSTVSFEELIKQLDEYFAKPTNIYTERKIFYEMKNVEDETSQEFMLRLKKAATFCDFGDHLEFVICDKFITSIKSNVIFNKICDESGAITTSKLIEIAKKCESRFQMKHLENEVNAISSFKKNKNKERMQNCQQQQNCNNKRADHDKKPICKHCGWNNHKSNNCRYKNFTCNVCNKVGHLAKLCKSNPENSQKRSHKAKEVNYICQNNSESDSQDFGYLDEIYSNTMYNESEDNADKPLLFALKILDKNINFLVDTGAKISAIPDSLYKKEFSNFKLSNVIGNAKSYGGHVLKVLGYFEVHVKFNRTEQLVMFYVIKDGQRPIVGRQFLRQFNIKNLEMYNINDSKDVLNCMLQKYDELFIDKLGFLKNVKVTLDVTENIQPIFVKARKIPFALVESVEKEIKKLEDEGIIEKIDSTEWGTPLVPILKENGQVRICADYKITINKFLKDCNHPLPNIDDILYKLRKAKFFSKLDLAKAYNQIELHDNSKMLVAWSTHMGNYKVNRLPFGIKPATGLFQREIERVLDGIDNIAIFLDDIIVTGATIDEHNSTLDLVLSKLMASGLKLNKSKCEFGKQEIVYLGYKLSDTGTTKIHKNEAISQFPVPNSITDIKSFCGLANYFGRNIDNLATKMTPLYNLLKKGNKFVWDENCQQSFDLIKSEMLSDKVMAKFNPELDIILTCDASGTGLGAVIAHKFPDGQERPIEYASRILNSAEKNYSTIEKEALAIIYGTKKFFKYLIGRKFILATDHKPLLKIFGHDHSIPQMSTSRLQRWAHHLSAFNYEIRHVKSEKNCADCLSRYSVERPVENKVIDNTYLNLIVNNSDVPIDFKMIQQNTEIDTDLKFIVKAIMENNFDQLDKSKYKAFIAKKDDLYIDQGVILWGYRVIVPTTLRKPLLEQVHQTHLGIVKTKSILRSYVWWPQIDKDIENLIKGCEACVMTLPNPPSTQVINWTDTERPWSRVHIDFAGPINKIYFFIMIDSHSKWIEVNYTKVPDTDFCIKCLAYSFSRFGLPDKIVSDNGPQFTAEKFKNFLKQHGISQFLTATYFPATNGAAENAVRTIKNALKSANFTSNMSNLDSILCNFLNDYRNSEHCSTKVSPASKVLNYKPKTKLDLILPKFEKNQELQFNPNDKPRRFFEENDEVVIRNYRGTRKWIRASIISKLGPRSYKCKLHTGVVIKRHINQIRRFKPKSSSDLNVELKTKPSSRTNKSSKQRYNIVRIGNSIQNEPEQAQDLVNQTLESSHSIDSQSSTIRNFPTQSSPNSSNSEVIIGDGDYESYSPASSTRIASTDYDTDSSGDYFESAILNSSATADYASNDTNLSEVTDAGAANSTIIAGNEADGYTLRDRRKIVKPQRYQD